MIKEKKIEVTVCDACSGEINITEDYLIEVYGIEEGTLQHFHCECFNDEIVELFSGKIVKIYKI